MQRWICSRLCPESICGMDTDEIFGYTTDKVVWIRDRGLGIPFYLGVFLILAYIVGVQMMLKCEHFKLMDVRGMAHITYSHPTKDHCDPTKSDCDPDIVEPVDLPYCKQYRGSAAVDGRAACVFQDFVQLVPHGDSDDKLFVPTAIEIITERRVCKKAEGGESLCTYHRLPGSDCLGSDESMCQTRGGQHGQFFYIADVDDYQLRFTSSFQRSNIHGTSLEYPGFVAVCEKLQPPRVSRSWSRRKAEQSDHECTQEDGYDIRKIPCEQGQECVGMRRFSWRETGRNSREDLEEALHKDFGLDSDDAEAPPAPDNFAAAAPPRKSERFTGALLQPRRPSETSGRTPTGATGLHARVSRERAGSGGRSELRHGEAHQHKVRSHRHRAQHHASRDVWAAAKEFTTPSRGDVFTLGRLMELAGVNLDLDHNIDGKSLRQAGTALEVRVMYSNMYPLYSFFGYHPVKYHYEVKELMIPAMERFSLSDVQPADYPEHRRYEYQHGTLILLKVDGSFGFFSLVYTFVLLTAAGALVSALKAVLDLAVIYLHPHGDNFFHSKYEVTIDYSYTWTCPKCNWKNCADDETCQGVPAWFQYDAPDVAKCGHPRPENAFKLSSRSLSGW